MFTPTPEQNAIVEASVSSKSNLLISALAGAAKTTTLELIAKANPGVNMMCLAFNKLIVEEMTKKLPKNCVAKTLNALGHSAWSDSIGKKCRIDFSKMGGIFKEVIAEIEKADQKEAWKSMGFVLKSVAQGKAAGYVPDTINERFEYRDEKRFKNTRLMSDSEFFHSLEEEPSALEWGMIRVVSERSILAAFKGNIDFGDQLLMPTCFKAFFPSYALILVDEAQDLSPLNHAMLDKLVKRRIIAVGDQCQAIYGFRGAHENGMAEMQSHFSMVEYPLSCSFRCPRDLVKHVHWRAPQMTWWEDNPANDSGAVHTRFVWSLAELPEECAIICRNNAPLFAMAVDLLQFGRYANLWGNDIAKPMMTAMKSLGNSATYREDALNALRVWHDKTALRARNKAPVRDRAACIRVFLDRCDTLGEAIAYAENVLSATGKIDLLTGHKSKGHEWSDVYFLDEQLIGDDDQEPNLRYVIATRTLANLTYVESSMLEEREARA
jgi:DNA helicase-2/ATP-dependent DNA helicase PcrA